MRRVYLFWFLFIAQCTGWPALQHTIEVEASKSSKGQITILSVLFMQKNVGVSFDSSGTGSSTPSTSTPSTSTPPTSTPPTSTSSKDITSFNIVNPVGVGIISGTNITVTIPTNYSLETRIATFTHTGVAVSVTGVNQVSGSTFNNFSNSVNYVVTGSDGATKTYAVTVSSANCSGASYCKIFAFGPAVANGNFGSVSGAGGDGIKGADLECATQALGLGMGDNFKAILMSGGSTIRNQTTNWVLYANKQYRRTDATTTIGTTNASSVFPIFVGTLVNSITPAFTNVYTGIDVVSDTSWNLGADHCSNWTNTAGNGLTAAGSSTGSPSFGGGPQACGGGFAIYCAQQ